MAFLREVPLARRNQTALGRTGVGKVKAVNLPRRLTGEEGREIEQKREGAVGIGVGFVKKWGNCSF